MNRLRHLRNLQSQRLHRSGLRLHHRGSLHRPRLRHLLRFGEEAFLRLHPTRGGLERRARQRERRLQLHLHCGRQAAHHARELVQRLCPRDRHTHLRVHGGHHVGATSGGGAQLADASNPSTCGVRSSLADVAGGAHRGHPNVSSVDGQSRAKLCGIWATMHAMRRSRALRLAVGLLH